MGLAARVITHSGQPPVQMNSQPARVRSASKRSQTDLKLDLSRCTFLTGDALKMLKLIRSGSIQCIITSPPFWPLRRTFGGMGIGYEKTLKQYIANLLAVLRECMRVLRKDGVLWLHLEDAHSHSGGQWRPDSYIAWRPTQQTPVMPSTTSIRPAKSLLMIPALVVLAMQDEGWLLRSKIIWDKGFAGRTVPKIGPRSRTANCSCSANRHATHRPDPIRVPYVGPPGGKLSSLPGHAKPGIIRRDVARDMRVYANPLGRNSGTVWRCNVANYRGAHTATFPPDLVRPMILASCTSADDIVLDPFGGAGTVALVALQLGFKAITIDIFPTTPQRHRTGSPMRRRGTMRWMCPIRRSPLIDELSGDADIGTDHVGQVRSKTPRQRDTGNEDVRGHAARRVQILTLRVPIRHSKSCRVLRLFRHRQSYFPSCEPVSVQ